MYPGLWDHDGPGRALLVDGRQTCDPGSGRPAATISLANIFNAVVQFLINYRII